MVAALRNDFTEGFENQDDEEFSVGHYLDKFQNSNNNNIDEEETIEGENVEGENVEGENIESESRESFQDTANIESENVESENVESENIESEDNELKNDENIIQEESEMLESNNTSIVEGFNGSKVLELNNEKVWLKSIMFGLLFYILSNPKIYDLTKGLSSQINKHMLHTIFFVVISYLLLLMI
jgi:hypothetical protein